MKQIRYPAGVHIGDRKVFVPLILGQCLLIAAVVVGHVAFLQAIVMICVDILIVALSMSAYARSAKEFLRHLSRIVQICAALFLALLLVQIFVVHPSPSERDSGVRLFSAFGDLVRDQWTNFDAISWLAYLAIMLIPQVVLAFRSGSPGRWWYVNMIVPMLGTAWGLVFCAMLAAFLGAFVVAKGFASVDALAPVVLASFAILRASVVWLFHTWTEPVTLEKQYRAFVAGKTVRVRF